MIDIRFIDSLFDVDPTQWNRIAGADYPFIRYEFLSALESSGATTAESGWQPQHVLVYLGSALVAIMPLYLKSHGYGEYVFDFSWADAYHRHNLNYYPKLVSAIPYTPVTGPRLCVAAGQNEMDIMVAVVQAIKKRASALSASSWHLLFPDAVASEQFNVLCRQRRAVHFQWFNQGFMGFDDFLATFNSRKRKNLRKERQRVKEQDIVFERWRGEDISDELWRKFHHFYQLTYARRSGHGGYLNLDFFRAVAASMPEAIVLVMVRQNGEYIAGALNFRDKRTLYGRYWGCGCDIEYLHFETCYYQGIEYCIEHGLQRFDPGVQGEHKMLRGFRPTYTYSNHWIADHYFRQAVDRFLQEEAKVVANYLVNAEKYLPFKHV